MKSHEHLLTVRKTGRSIKSTKTHRKSRHNTPPTEHPFLKAEAARIKLSREKKRKKKIVVFGGSDFILRGRSRERRERERILKKQGPEMKNGVGCRGEKKNEIGKKRGRGQDK
ncbi:hypothetical protein NPIL_11971 [Nephila pilipes]|uniref:Uncharacterized protein n=1 Tax=Nephila pilipes TaxID=299642 RepID=A0A8X6QY66_NEPPI|nr:hypothetical protein NPIL_11971 [Nephila pilipes]